MPDEGNKKHGADSRPEETNGKIEVRPRNWLVPVTLLTLRECTTYGYKLMEQTAKFGFETMNPGTYYRTLRNMEKDGLCESEWDTSGGPGPATPGVLDHGRWGSLSGLLGRGFGAVPAQHGRLLQFVHGKQTTSRRRPAERRWVAGGPSGVHSPIGAKPRLNRS
jgi:hypothetical protein